MSSAAPRAYRRPSRSVGSNGGLSQARAARRPARRSGRREHRRRVRPRGAQLADGHRMAAVHAHRSALPPAASIRSQTQSARARERGGVTARRSRPTGCAASRPAPHAASASAAHCAETHESSHAPPAPLVSAVALRPRTRCSSRQSRRARPPHFVVTTRGLSPKTRRRRLLDLGAAEPVAAAASAARSIAAGSWWRSLRWMRRICVALGSRRAGRRRRSRRSGPCAAARAAALRGR